MAQRFKTDELAAVRDFMRAAKEVFEHHVRGPVAARRGVGRRATAPRTAATACAGAVSDRAGPEGR